MMFVGLGGRKVAKRARKALRPSSGSPNSCRHKTEEDTIMLRKFTAIVAALGFLASTSLTPVLAAPSLDTPLKSDDLSAAKKKKPAKKAKKKKMGELVIS